jgi:hypothetical protein
MGIYDLGQEALTDYADRFFFNRSIPFDYPMTSSTIDVPENGFGLAEIASGFCMPRCLLRWWQTMAKWQRPGWWIASPTKRANSFTNLDAGCWSPPSAVKLPQN